MTGHDLGRIPETIDIGTVHLWLVNGIGSVPEELASSFLTEDELLRAEQLAPEPAHRYRTTRALLRTFLGTYLQLPPRAATIFRGQYGKPYADPAQAGNLMFNLSDTCDTALYGFSMAGEIGVDIESSNRGAHVDRVARRAMTPRELDWFTTLPAHIRREAFFTTWTRKEAFLKSIGTGLIVPMRSINVQGKSPCLVSFPGKPPDVAGTDDWWIVDIRCFEGYYGAFALPALPPVPLTGVLDATDILQS